MRPSPLYDQIGKGYRSLRVPDRRISAQVIEALDGCRRVLNVGAGAASYEPHDRYVTAVEPSSVMIAQRPVGAAPVIRGVAQALPIGDKSFDAAMAVLTIHHWMDIESGLSELTRVASKRIAILTWDPAHPGFWLDRYFPEILDIDRPLFPAIAMLEQHLGLCKSVVVPIPHDCTDGFLGAYWRRPEAYLRADVRAAISTFSKLSDIETGLSKLRADLAAGHWRQRNGHLVQLHQLDLGYRLLIFHDFDNPQ